MQANKDKCASRLVTGLDFASRWCAYIGAVLLFIMCAIIGYDVAMRKFFDKPTDWAVDFAEYIMAYAAFLGAPWVLKLDAHIKVGILHETLSPSWRWGLNRFNEVIGFFVSVVILWQGILATWDAYVHNLVLPRPIEVPRFAVLIVIPFAGLLFMLYFGVRIAQGLWGERKIEPPADSKGAE